ncbi:hypothetical protein EDD37DRAFT_402492 [Exophiala viscosa]|uniref:Zn(2)-C6 fungal-type domain-containing protein n=1 Tax=Exophiala viscosa TaxID=2486360 RepID=A0AAN6IEU9_9EURO|nr:hypothetical protein EDD36DRAFT_168959 [Exophiala viscosa]KAI1624173.1 hypothetical protein EDD37DRAFT_402492 [Exophiala viscosa]
MVYHGVSRGCETCKRRRKKCDEARPVCNRCIKAKRTCLGYKPVSDLIFRTQRFDRGNNHPIIQQLHTNNGHRVTVAIRRPPVLTLTEWHTSEFEQTARDSFLQNYCIVPSDPSLSRGYLDGLPRLIEHYGPLSELSRVLTIVAFASYGNKHRRPEVAEKAKILYFELLQSFRSSILNVRTSNIVGSLMTAVLLGLYEIISTHDSTSAAHSTHTRGVCALLSSSHSPFDINTGAQVFQMANPLRLSSAQLQQSLSSFGILCAPVSSRPVQTLDSILLKTRPLHERMQRLMDADTIVPADEVHTLREEMELLADEYAQWPQNQPREWSPKTVGFADADSITSSICWQGKVEGYFDLYVSAVWNSYRKARLLYLERVIHFEEHFRQDARRFDVHPTDLPRYHPSKGIPLQPLFSQIQELATDVAASVPFHLTNSGKAWQFPLGGDAAHFPPGRSVGGLLLLHPLFVASKRSTVSPDLRAYFRKCLAWVATHMGIGQAAIFAKDTDELPLGFIRDGHVLVWAGMLISQT